MTIYKAFGEIDPRRHIFWLSVEFLKAYVQKTCYLHFLLKKKNIFYTWKKLSSFILLHLFDLLFVSFIHFIVFLFLYQFFYKKNICISIFIHYHSLKPILCESFIVWGKSQQQQKKVYTYQ